VPAGSPGAEQAARTAVELAPLRESARAALLDVLGARGNLAEALVGLEQVRTSLRDEPGAFPGSALSAAHQRLLGLPAAPVEAAVSAEAGRARPSGCGDLSSGPRVR
jgi:DNA-binding SARP family transcriptional activator